MRKRKDENGEIKTENGKLNYTKTITITKTTKT